MVAFIVLYANSSRELNSVVESSQLATALEKYKNHLLSLNNAVVNITALYKQQNISCHLVHLMGWRGHR